MRSYHAVPVVSSERECPACAFAGLILGLIAAGLIAGVFLTSRVSLPLDEWMCTERAGAECVKWERRASGN